ncbi:MAG: hypothetical protein K6G18_04680 [Treponema sp.]|nr:hypothetical protein [Treponema sp.]
MKVSSLKDVTFDKEDSLLFSYSDDLLLKAKAIQNSILPKLHVLLQESISLVRKVYEIEIYDENSTLSKYPSFRENRENELKANYESAFVGICGSRLPVWKEMKRLDKLDVKILPIRYGFELNKNCLSIIFRYDTDLSLSLSSYAKLRSAFYGNLNSLLTICNRFGFQIRFENGRQNILSSIKEQLKQNDVLDCFCISKHFYLPVECSDFSELPLCFASLIPFYDAMLRIAKGESNRFKSLVSKLQYYVASLPEEELPSNKKRWVLLL